MITKKILGTKQLFQKVTANNWPIIRELYSTANDPARPQVLPGTNYFGEFLNGVEIVHEDIQELGCSYISIPQQSR